MYKSMRNLLFCTILLVLASCVETVVVGTIGTGAIVTKEKSIFDTKDDIIIAAKIEKNLLSNNLSWVNAEVEEQRVLLTGIAYSSEEAKKAVSVCWKVDDVKEVIDEIQVIDCLPSISDQVVTYATDSAITAEIKSRFLFKKNVKSANFEVTTVNGAVYLIGIARDDDEVNKINTIAAKTRGVKRVISHIVTVDDSRRKSSN